MHEASAVKDHSSQLRGNRKFPAFVKYKKEKIIKQITFTVSTEVLKERLESLEQRHLPSYYKHN